MARLTIGEYARGTWLTEKALRLYDRRGLLRPAAIDPGTGYRYYDELQIEDGRLIALLRRLDMPLALIAEVLTAAPDQRRELILQYQRHRDADYARTRVLSEFLARAVGVGRFDGYEAGGVFDVGWRRVPAQHVWRWQGRVTARELPTAIAIGIRAGLLRSRRPDRPFVRYLDPVGWDADGRIEVCVPDLADPTDHCATAEPAEEVGLGAPPSIDLPAHEEAFVTVTPQAAQFPVILGAYEALTSAVTTAGKEPAPPFHEVYPAAIDREVLVDIEGLSCEVALPVRPQ